jgi:hypothetical protein
MDIWNFRDKNNSCDLYLPTSHRVVQKECQNKEVFDHENIELLEVRQKSVKSRFGLQLFDHINEPFSLDRSGVSTPVRQPENFYEPAARKAPVKEEVSIQPAETPALSPRVPYRESREEYLNCKASPRGKGIAVSWCERNRDVSGWCKNAKCGYRKKNQGVSNGKIEPPHNTA